ncbi:MAG: tRNA 2-selenouridine(34) synthase MnmH [Bacteroidota bacterium]|jgi:tRNA 2-selenouridine synthase
MMHPIEIDEFLELSQQLTVLDVRSEKEFAEGHFPGAVNIPMLNDEERKLVGTIYKHNGRQPAVYKGLELTGPHLVDRLRKGVKYARNGKVLVHCWRGGMRSEFFAFLLHYYGIEPIVLNGGYKAYRTAVHASFDKLLDVKIIAGKSGAGKTEIMKELRTLGEQVIDLEDLAKHRGSSFGGLGFEMKVSQEQFENHLFAAFKEIDPRRPVWIEDENRTIGDKVLPDGIWKQMLQAPRFLVERTFEERLDKIVRDYGIFPTADLKAAMTRIGKRLGPQHVKAALEMLDEGLLREAFALALGYYDKAYLHQLSSIEKERVHSIQGEGISYQEIALKLREALQ